MARLRCDVPFRKRLAWLAGAGVCALAVFLLTTNILLTHSPIFFPMVCNITGRNFGQERMDEQGVHVNGTAVTSCSNPNALTIEMKPIQDTKIYLVLGEEMSIAGTATFAPQLFPPDSSTSMSSETSMNINHTQLRGILQHHMAFGEPMMMSVEHVWARVEVDLYGLKLRSPWQERESRCAWSINPMKRQNGPVVCENSLSALRPIVKPANATVQPFALPVPPEEIARAEQVRDWACATLMFLSSLVLAEVSVRSVSLWRTLRQRTQRQVKFEDELPKTEEDKTDARPTLRLPCCVAAGDDETGGYRPATTRSGATLTTRASSPNDGTTEASSPAAESIGEALFTPTNYELNDAHIVQILPDQEAAFVELPTKSPACRDI
eukprot:TRINITY_DN45855_c0_g1_i3.p1 TRINITY_DN45855_c0_g1~~TRINITY_DN45855_c0_g1_i3.p1  ORF type:complete len:406 (-),score=36.89 TRINITY_DN45855_c0_g1_i3:602-1741(-)